MFCGKMRILVAGRLSIFNPILVPELSTLNLHTTEGGKFAPSPSRVFFLNSVLYNAN